MSIAGTGLAVAGASGGGGEGPIIIGGGFALAGVIVATAAHFHVGKAGRYLTGNGVSVPLNGTKKRKPTIHE